MGSTTDFEVTEFVLGGALNFTSLRKIRNELGKAALSKCSGHVKFIDWDGIEALLYFVAHKDGRKVELNPRGELKVYEVKEKRGKLYITEVR